MKFESKEYAQLFCIEIGRNDLINKVDRDFSPDDEMMEVFIKKRKAIIPGLKDFKKSQDTKGQWNKNRYNIMKGIKKFHKSTKGKRFHRNLGRFLVSRIFRDKFGSKNKKQEDMNDVLEALKSITSLKTHSIIEIQYYHTLHEEIEYAELFSEIIEVTTRAEGKLLKLKNDLSEKDLDLLLRCINEDTLLNIIAEISLKSADELKEEFDKLLESKDKSYVDIVSELLKINEPADLIKSFADKSGKSEKEVEDAWNSIKKDLLNKGEDEEDPDFYKKLVGILKKALKIS